MFISATGHFARAGHFSRFYHTHPQNKNFSQRILRILDTYLKATAAGGAIHGAHCGVNYALTEVDKDLKRGISHSLPAIALACAINIVRGIVVGGLEGPAALPRVILELAPLP